MMQQLRLTAGPLSVVFDRELATLRYVRLGEREIVRGVYAAVRDQDWNTVAFSVSDLKIRETDDSFNVSFLATCAQPPIVFEWRGNIRGERDGTVRFEFNGEAKSAFARNRIGICVLHPIAECVGQPCRVEHSDGPVTDGEFPRWISPHQPFKNIRSITHDVMPDVEAKVSFDGDVFEMEDQRNWSDASFKTYCTPLELPFPVEIAQGTRIEQSVTIELLGEGDKISALPASAKKAALAPRIHVDWEQTKDIPTIGLSMATVQEPVAEHAVNRLREVGLDHLRVDVRLTTDHWQQRLIEAKALADAIDAKLEIALFVESVHDASWQQCLNLLARDWDRIARWLVFHPTANATPAELASSAATALLEFAPNIPFAFGTDAYFAELNRNRSLANEADHVCFSINPQVHAFDNLSLRETLQSLPWLVDSADQIFACPVVISPITLRPRFNPNATSDSAEDGGYQIPESDPRQSSGFTAAWTVGTLARLATHPRVSSLTFFETFGPRGIMSGDGSEFKVYDVFATLDRSISIFATTSDQPLDVTAIALDDGAGRRDLLLANMSDEKQTVHVNDVDGKVIPVEIQPQSVRHMSQEVR